MSRVVHGNFQVALKRAQLALDHDDDQQIIGRRTFERPQPYLFGVEHLLEGREPRTRLSNEHILGRLLRIATPTASSKVIVKREVTQHVTRHSRALQVGEIWSRSQAGVNPRFCRDKSLRALARGGWRADTAHGSQGAGVSRVARRSQNAVDQNARLQKRYRHDCNSKFWRAHIEFGADTEIWGEEFDHT